MITDFGIQYFWDYVYIMGMFMMLVGAGIGMCFQCRSSTVSRIGWALGIISAAVVIASIGLGYIHDTEQYDMDMRAIQDSIDLTGDIATQSELLCQTGDIPTTSCNRVMFDWYMSNHYDPTSNESMQIATRMRWNIG